MTENSNIPMVKNRKRRSREKWKELIGRQKESGQSVSSFCKAEDVLESSFYRWKKIVETQMPEGRFIQVLGSSESGVQKKVELDLGDGRILRIF